MAISLRSLAIAASLKSYLAAHAAILIASTFIALAFCAPSANAQVPPGGMPSEEQISKLPPEIQAKVRAQMQKMQGAQPMPGPQQPAGDKPKKDEGGDKKPEGGDKPKEEESKTIKRPTTPETKADPEELKAKADKDGMVQFSFRGQPWPEVMQWFADVAGYSLDWQELPNDYLNLTAPRKYTIAETRDLLNRELLARGFTMILQKPVLSVMKTDKLDPSLIPRVDPDDLEDLAPHEFARTRFDLPESLDPAKAAEDVKILLSPAAKVTPLLASKRLLVIDAVANLRDVRDLLYSEKSAIKSDIRPKQFPIRYRRAEYVADQVMIVLGMDPSQRKGPMEMQLEQQRLQLMMQMQQQGKDITSMIKKDGPPVFIAVDRQHNSITVNAPPKEMDIVQRTIEQLDVPENGEPASTGTSPASAGPLTLEKYQTATANPDNVVTALKEVGGLSPLTQLQGDGASKTIFAYATPEDHKTIKRMIEKLEAGGRSLRVVWLSRRTPADQIAGTIKALMVGEKKQENRSPFFDYFNRGNNDQPKETGFRIQADVDNNRLLLWASDSEYKEVDALLEKLGATVSRGGSNPNKFRVLEARSPQETAEILERLQHAWAGQNKLNINVAPQQKAAPETEKPKAKPADDEKAEKKDRLTGLHLPSNVEVVHVQLAPFMVGEPSFRFIPVAEAVATTNEPSTASPPIAAGAPASAGESESASRADAPPINITVTPDGRILLSSDDPAALDELEQLVAELEPQERSFEVFHLRNARASMVWQNLNEYFTDELGDKDNKNDFGFIFLFDERPPKDEEQATLGKHRKLRFVYDIDTNTIVAQNASASQLQVIRELVKIYDQPVGEDAVAKRRTEIVPVRYSRAADIAASLKEVYRDLLSSKDKEFQGNDKDKGTRTQTFYRFSGGSDDNKKTAPVKMAFEGALSVGVDEISNTLIISAEDQIFDNIKNIITTLDEKAKPDTVVQVHELRGAIHAKDLQKVLAAAMSQPWPGGKPEKAAANQGAQQGGQGDQKQGQQGKAKKGGGDNNDNN